MIGVAQIPMGIVGPLTVRGEHIDGDVWVPMATTEGRSPREHQPRAAPPSARPAARRCTWTTSA